MTFKFSNYEDYMLNDIVEIWNEEVYLKTIIDKFTVEDFNNKVIKNPHFKNEGFKILLQKNQIIGFGLGLVTNDKVETPGYIPFIVVREEFQRKGLGTKILNELELFFKENNKNHIREIFFSPVNLQWIIPGTKDHIHPGTPAVSYNSPFYYLLINNGFYINGQNQDAYYLNIKNFEMPEKLNLRIQENENKGYFIEIYDSKKHYGEETLFKDLNNPGWYEAFKNNVNNDNHPMLVVVKENEILGWTGPVYTKEDKRGYFAGIGVSPKAGGLGLGTILFNRLVLESKNNKAEYMSLFTGQENVAQKIYKRTGFKIVNTFAILRKDI